MKLRTNKRSRPEVEDGNEGIRGLPEDRQVCIGFNGVARCRGDDLLEDGAVAGFFGESFRVFRSAGLVFSPAAFQKTSAELRASAALPVFRVSTNGE
jgi:hypothetical protein